MAKDDKEPIAADRADSVPRQVMKSRQTKVQQWLSENTSIVGSKTDNQGKPVYLASQWLSAAEEAVNSGRTIPLAIIYGLNDVLAQRVQATKWFEKNGLEHDRDANISHAAFNERQVLPVQPRHLLTASVCDPLHSCSKQSSLAQPRTLHSPKTPTHPSTPTKRWRLLQSWSQTLATPHHSRHSRAPASVRGQRIPEPSLSQVRNR